MPKVFGHWTRVKKDGLGKFYSKDSKESKVWCKKFEKGCKPNNIENVT